METFVPETGPGVSFNRVEPGLWRDESNGQPLPTMEYVAVVPRDFDANRAHPVLILLPPGGQDRMMASAALAYVQGEAVRTGWVVIVPLSPQAPDEETKKPSGKTRGDAPSLLDVSPAAIDRLCEHVARRVQVRAGVFHLAGVSNGGRSAFRWATLAPHRFASLTVLPGFAEDTDLERLGRLKNIPVRMYVGQKDDVWVKRCEKTRDALQKAGATVQLQVLANEEHVLRGVGGKLILDGARASTTNTPSAPVRGESGPNHDEPRESANLTATAQASAVLDLLHERASKADERGYFELFTRDAIFLGTDATERWTTEQFRAYAAPAFGKGKGWTYHPIARRLSASASGDCVWFDEDLSHDRYGRCRGSGVLVWDGGDSSTDEPTSGRWRIAQYNLSVPIPNEHLLSAVGLWKRP